MRCIKMGYFPVRECLQKKITFKKNRVLSKLEILNTTPYSMVMMSFINCIIATCQHRLQGEDWAIGNRQ